MSKKVIAFLITVCMVIGMVPAFALAADGDVTVYDVNDGSFHKLSGTWASSGLLGPDGAPSIYNDGVATAEWRPELLFGGKFKVSYWIVPHATNAQEIILEVGDKSGVKQIEITDHATLPEGWYDLGEYEFTAGTDNYIKVSSVAGEGFARPSAIQLELLERGQGLSGADLVPATGEEPEIEGYGTRTLTQKDVTLPEPKADATQIFVAPGATGGDGSEASPLGSVAEAQAKVQEIIAGGYPAGGIVVNLKGGTYALDDTLQFSQADSGTEDAPVIWRAYNGEEVTFTGGKVIENSNFTLVEDADTLSRIPSEGKGKVYETDLSASGISDIPKMDLRESVPYVFVIGDKAGILSRWPNEGYGRTANLIDSSSRSDSGPRKKGFTYEISDPRPLRWTQATDVWLNGYWMTPYTIDYARLAVLDTDNMKLSGKEWNGLGSYGNARYFVQNLLEEIDMEGEWYVDTEANKLYMYPYEGWEQEQIMFAPKTFGIVEFADSSNIILRDINLEVAGGNGVTFAAESSNCAVIGGDIMNVSGVGASINGNNNYVRDCDISYTGAQGITINGGDEYNLISSNNYAENNEIHDTGTGGGSKQGITIGGCGNRVSNNHIYNTPTHGLNGGGTEIIIENNIIERTNMEMGDTGGLYYLNYGMGYGTKIRNNIVKDSVGMIAQTMTGEGALGIYLDDMTSGVEVTGNIVFNAQEPGIFGHGGRNLTIDNNILINCETPIRVVKTGIAKNLEIDGVSGTNIRKFNQEVWDQKYPEAYETLTDQFGEPKYNTITNNVTFNSGSYNYANGVSNSGTESGNIQIEGLPNANLNDFYDFDYSAIKAQNPNFKELDIANMGTYTGGARTDTESIVFNNSAEPYNLTYPVNGEQNVDPNTTLKWSLGKGGIRTYTVYVSAKEDFSDLAVMQSVTEGSLDVSLDYGTTYYWRVVATPLLDYDQRWNENGVCSFTTISAGDKLEAELASANHLLEVTEEGTSAGQVESGSKAALEAAVQQGEAAKSGDDSAKKQAINALIDAQTEYSSKIIPNTEQLSTLIYDDYSLDTVGERPLGLFLRSYSPLNVTAQPDPLNGDNQVVMFKDEHPKYHYGMQYFDPQSSYVVAGTSVMPAQTNAAFSFSVMRAGVYPVESGVANNCAAKIIFGLDGNIYGDKNKQFNLMPYQANQWYDIQAKIRLNEGTYDVYINGTKMAENIPLCDTTVKQVNQIVFDTSDATTNSDSAMGTFYIDNSIVKAPASPGKNQYLMSLKINGSEVDGFEPAKEFYYVNMSADELQSANIEYTAGNNAYVKVWDIDGGKCVTVVSADKMNTSSYVIKAQ